LTCIVSEREPDISRKSRIFKTSSAFITVIEDDFRNFAEIYGVKKSKITVVKDVVLTVSMWKTWIDKRSDSDRQKERVAIAHNDIAFIMRNDAVR